MHYLILFVSVEPAEEPIEIEEPEDGILWMTDLLREWASQGLISAVKMRDRKNFPIPDCFYKVTPFFSRSFLADSTESTPV